MVDPNARQPRLFSLPPPNGSGHSESAAEQYRTWKPDAEVTEGAFVGRPTFELTCWYQDVTLTKRFALPYAWCKGPEIAAIFAAYGDQFREDLVKREG